MNIIRTDLKAIYLNIFPKNEPSYYLHYPYDDARPFINDREITRTYYRNQIVMPKDSRLIDTTASTWDEARQLHPELFI